MGWAGQTWLTLTPESVYGEADTGPGVTPFYPRLLGGNSFGVRVVPQRQVIRSADSGNRPLQVVASRKVLQGTLNTLLYPSQAAFWATALSLTGTAGTPTPPTIPSFSALYFDSVRIKQYVGGRLAKATFTSDSDQDYVTASFDWIFQKPEDPPPAFPEPAQTNYPAEPPYVHIETGTHVTLGGTTVTKYKSITVTIANVLAPTFNEESYISSLYYCGRDLTFSIVPEYIDPSYRLDFEDQQFLAWVLNWTRGTHSLNIDCEASTTIGSIDDDLPLDGPGYQTINNEVFFDVLGATDFTISAT